MLRDLGLKIRQVQAMEATKKTLAFVSSQGSKRGNRVMGILILRGVLHLEDVALSPRRAMELRCAS